MTALSRHPHRPWSFRRKLIVFGMLATLLVMALAVGLGVGLPRRRPYNTDTTSASSSSSSSSSSSTTTTTSSAPYPTATSTLSGNSTLPGTLWQPVAGTSWNYQLRNAIGDNPSKGAFDIWDVDLFDNSGSSIAALQSQGAKVICYFSAGSYENWRPDADQFNKNDLGNDLSGWEGEKWINISSPSVRLIMQSRLDMAVQKGCDAVDPDNVDGYSNSNGLGLTQQNSVDYMLYLASAARSRNLAIGLKNAGDIIPEVINVMQFSVNEQCAYFNECSTYAPFVQAGKPVLHVEYPKGSDTNDNNNVSTTYKNKACSADSESGFSTIMKNMNLDTWIQTCS